MTTYFSLANTYELQNYRVCLALRSGHMTQIWSQMVTGQRHTIMWCI